MTITNFAYFLLWGIFQKKNKRSKSQYWIKKIKLGQLMYWDKCVKKEGRERVGCMM